VISPNYDNILIEDNNLFKVQKDEKWGLCDSKGSLIAAIEYDAIMTYPDSPTIVAKDGKFSYIDDKREFIFDKKFEEAHKFIEGAAAVSEKDNLWGIIDLTGKWIAQPHYTILFLIK
jgi:hypothetical protein